MVRNSEQPAVLIVDDDSSTSQAIAWALRPLSVHVEIANCGADAVTRVRDGHFDVMLVDARLPDMRGLDLVRALQVDYRFNFVLLSGIQTTSVTVDAMRLGAIDVIDKPVRVDSLVATVISAKSVPRLVPAPRAARPRSIPERWATHVLKACGAGNDLKTLDDWATCVGVSYSSLCESCRLLKIRPHDARDFLRVLRALMAAQVHRCPPEALFDVSDRRTLDTLLKRAGLDRRSAAATSIEDYLQRQTFVSQENEGIKALCRLMAEQAIR